MTNLFDYAALKTTFNINITSKIKMKYTKFILFIYNQRFKRQKLKKAPPASTRL